MTAYRFRLTYVRADGSTRVEIATRYGRTSDSAFRKVTDYASDWKVGRANGWRLRSVEAVLDPVEEPDVET